MTETGDRDVVPVARTGNGRKQKKQMKHDVSFLSLSLSLKRNTFNPRRRSVRPHSPQKKGGKIGEFHFLFLDDLRNSIKKKGSENRNGEKK